MLVEVKVPALPESVSEATLVTWHKQIGEFVKRDEILIDIETDKIVFELPSPESGQLVEVLQQDGSSVIAGQLIAMIDPTAIQSAVEKIKQLDVLPVSGKKNMAEDKIAMPAAETLAASSGIDLNQLTGSGKNKRILKEDVQQAISQQQNSAKLWHETKHDNLDSTPDMLEMDSSLTDRSEQYVPMSRLRQRVAERLLLSQQTNAILTTFNEVNLKQIMDLRAKYKEKFFKEYNVRLGFISFFVKAAVTALKKYPIVNASVDGNNIVYHGYFDIGIAVSSPRGLVVPVLRNVDQMSIADIERQIADFADRAQSGHLSMEELSGGTFSITNGGTFGSMMSTPIINPPQSAILGMHASKDRAVVEDGQIVIRPMMYLALSYDHRIIDGREAVLSLVAIKEALEDPARLILGL